MCMNDAAEWIALNYNELSKKFAGKYVAIVNQKIIASGVSSTKVIKKADKILPDKDVVFVSKVQLG